MQPCTCSSRAARLLICLVCIAVLCSTEETAAFPSRMHTVFGAECNNYFDWQSLGVVYSHRKAGVPGPITRLLTCSEAMLREYTNIDLVPTHVAPSATISARTGDEYTAYNKPAAILHWLQQAPAEDWILIIDPDMILRDSMADWGASHGAHMGWAVSVYFNYMVGTHNNLSDTHISEIVPRTNALAGPRGRRSDQVSAVVLMHRDDLQRVAPLWLKYSEDVRADPMAWNETNDEYAVKPGMKPWIAEMYGYSFGAAKANVWHKIDFTAMLYPSKSMFDSPRIMHYGRQFDVGTYKFRKHWYHNFNATTCPPWPHMAKQSYPATGGLFPHPPRPSTLQSTTATERYKDLLAIQVVATINAGLCARHMRDCPPSTQLTEECTQVHELEAEVDAAIEALESDQHPEGGPVCRDWRDKECRKWADKNMCSETPQYMHLYCRRACGLCRIPRSRAGQLEGGEAEADSQQFAATANRLPSETRPLGSLVSVAVGVDDAPPARAQTGGLRQLEFSDRASSAVLQDVVIDRLQRPTMHAPDVDLEAVHRIVFAQQRRPSAQRTLAAKPADSAVPADKDGDAAPAPRDGNGNDESENEDEGEVSAAKAALTSAVWLGAVAAFLCGLYSMHRRGVVHSTMRRGGSGAGSQPLLLRTWSSSGLMPRLSRPGSSQLSRAGSSQGSEWYPIHTGSGRAGGNGAKASKTAANDRRGGVLQLHAIAGGPVWDRLAAEVV